MTLREMQREMQAAILSNGPVPTTIRADRLSPEARLQVYRNNTLITLTEALRANFPVVDRLVGDAFFARLARAYFQAHPPGDGVLLWLGADFPAFIAGFEPAAGLPYLPDVARLEHEWVRAYHAADAAPLPIRALARVAPDRLEAARLTVHPSVRLLNSPYPIHRIWAANQDGAADDPVSLDEGEAYLLLTRPDLDVLIHALPPAEWHLISCLERGAALGEAVAAAGEALDLGQALARLFSAGAFAALHIGDEGEMRS